MNHLPFADKRQTWNVIAGCAAFDRIDQFEKG